ncbi:MAG TPA: hypothetical protein PK066_19245 [Saprospiraceae bacterium]|nr:hypothetical protein [Saprospiraceae bacterium]
MGFLWLILLVTSAGSVLAEHVPANWDDMVIGKWYDLIEVGRMPFKVMCDPRIPGRMYCLLEKSSCFQPAYSNDYGQTWTIWEDNLPPAWNDIIGNLWFESRFTPEGEAFFYYVASFFIEDERTSVFKIFMANEAGENWREVCRLDQVGFKDSITGFTVSSTGSMVFGAHLPERGTGLCLSTDNGQTWREVWCGNEWYCTFNDIEFSPVDPDIAYATLQYPGTLVLKSIDGGLTWQNTNFNEPGVDPQYGIEAVVLHPTNPDVLYFIKTELLGNFEYSIKLSIDGGESWMDWGPHDAQNKLKISGMFINPDNPNNILVFGLMEYGNLYLTEDGGNNWELKLSGGHYTRGARNSITCAKSPWEVDKMYLSLAGIKISTDNGISWLPKQPLDITTAISGDVMRYVDETDLQHMVYFQDEVGAFHSSDAGQTWHPSTINHNSWIFGKDAYDRCLSSPFNRSSIFMVAGYPNTVLLRSDDYGVNWDVVWSDSQLNVWYYFLSSSVPGRVYAVVYNDDQTQFSMIRSDDSGDTWVSCSDFPPNYRIWTARDCPDRPELIFVITENLIDGNGYLLQSIDGGITWIQVSAESGFSPENRAGSFTESILFHTTLPGCVYAATSNKQIYESIDYGVNWVLTKKWVASNRMRIHRSNPDFRTALTGISKTNGKFWSNLGCCVEFLPDNRDDIIFSDKQNFQIVRTDDKTPKIILAGYLNTKLFCNEPSPLVISTIVEHPHSDVELDSCEVLYESEPVGIHFYEDDNIKGVFILSTMINSSTPILDIFQIVPMDRFGNVGETWPTVNSK